MLKQKKFLYRILTFFWGEILNVIIAVSINQKRFSSRVIMRLADMDCQMARANGKKCPLVGFDASYAHVFFFPSSRMSYKKKKKNNNNVNAFNMTARRRRDIFFGAFEGLKKEQRKCLRDSLGRKRDARNSSFLVWINNIKSHFFEFFFHSFFLFFSLF